MKTKSGISLLETIVVIAIIAVLSLLGVNNINNFRKDAQLDNAVNEMVSDIRLARSKSMNGDVLGGETSEDFDQNGLPEYGIVLFSDSYQLVRKCLKHDGSTCSDEVPIEDIKIDPDYTISPEGNFYFDRVTGNTDDMTILIEEKEGVEGRRVHISKDFNISITKI